MSLVFGAIDNKTRNLKNCLFWNGTWNIRPLLKLGAAQSIVKKIEKYKIKIVVLLEIRKNDTSHGYDGYSKINCILW